MSTLRQIRGKRWQAIIRRKGFPKQYQTFDTQKEALQWSRLVESKLDQGILFNYTAVAKTLFRTLIERYLIEITPFKRSKEREISRLRIIRQALGDYSLENLKAEVVAHYRDERLMSGCSGATVIKDIHSISHIYEVARREWGYAVIDNPTKLIRKPKANPSRIRRLSSDEEIRLIQACNQSRSIMIKSMVIFAIETGMRASEILNLTWQDIHDSIATIHESKNGQRREVPLSKKALREINHLPKHISSNRIFWKWKNYSGFKNTWQRIIKVSEIKNLRFHDLRHEAISRLFEKGLNPIEVATISGHQTLQVLKAYTHIKVSHLVEKLENINL